MKVILLQDIPKIGKKWEVKNVSSGFARNYLIPKGLVRVATDSALEGLDIQKKENIEKAEEELAYVQELASKLDGLEIETSTKVSSKGELYSAISAQNISDTLSSMNYMIDKEQIKIEKPIKQLGDYQIPIIFKHGIEAEIKLVVIKEQPPKD